MNYNIFDVYRKGSKKLLANNIAILKNDTFKNRFLQSGNSLNIKIRKNLNKALDKFSNDKKVNVPDNWKIYDQINKDSERFKKYNKNVLINIFKDELKK
ncbi:MAG: hypothetical protein K9K76_07205 [Halanaerobiales bacterium]|nr:hypothetical protein [Halanaerobiales bacterium]